MNNLAWKNEQETKDSINIRQIEHSVKLWAKERESDEQKNLRASVKTRRNAAVAIVKSAYY